MAKNILNRNHTAKAAANLDDPNDLKMAIRDGLSAMNIQERSAFINDLESEMVRINLDIRSYLVPLGIPGRSPDDLTPTEVGHLVRFLKLNVPQAMRAVERAMARHGAFGSEPRPSGDRLAA